MPLLLDNDDGGGAMWLPVWIGFGTVNALGFLLMGIDKWKAKKGSRKRIRERTLLIIAAFFGALGVYLGLKCFRHKTRHRSFTVTLPLFILVQAVLAVLLIKYR